MSNEFLMLDVLLDVFPRTPVKRGREEDEQPQGSKPAKAPRVKVNILYVLLVKVAITKLVKLLQPGETGPSHLYRDAFTWWRFTACVIVKLLQPGETDVAITKKKPTVPFSCFSRDCSSLSIC